MFDKVKKTIEKNIMLTDGDAVIVALSGGADSCALLSILVDLVPVYHLQLIVAHFNHGLRGDDADQDEAFCRKLSLDYGLPFNVAKMHLTKAPKGVSPEEYFRLERYRFLDQVAIEHHAQKIALGHNLNDQAETVLFNILRGAGLDGLKGFLPVRDGKYIRPLMDISRSEIEHYLKLRELTCREDRSNQNRDYMRNRIRLDLMPYLKEKFNPRIEQSLYRLSEIARLDDECLNDVVRDILSSTNLRHTPEGIYFSCDLFIKLKPAIRLRMIKLLLEDLSGHSNGFSYVHIQQAVNLITNKPTGKKISLPFQLEIEKQYKNIFIGKKVTRPFFAYEYLLPESGEIHIREKQMILSVSQISVEEIDFSRPRTVYMDADCLKMPLLIRNRRHGDWFEPLGMHGKQKIKKLMIDRKIPASEREKLALVVDQLSVIWIENVHLNDRVKISKETKHVLMLEFQAVTPDGGLV